MLCLLGAALVSIEKPTEKMLKFSRVEWNAIKKCVDRITKVLSRDVTIAEGLHFYVDGSSTTIINPGMDLLDSPMDISSIIKEYYKKRNK